MVVSMHGSGCKDASPNSIDNILKNCILPTYVKNSRKNQKSRESREKRGVAGQGSQGFRRKGFLEIIKGKETNGKKDQRKHS